MEHELRREISLQPAGSSQQNKKVGPRKIGTRLLYPQSVTVTSFCDTHLLLNTDINIPYTRITNLGEKILCRGLEFAQKLLPLLMESHPSGDPLR